MLFPNFYQVTIPEFELISVQAFIVYTLSAASSKCNQCCSEHCHTGFMIDKKKRSKTFAALIRNFIKNSFLTHISWFEITILPFFNQTLFFLQQPWLISLYDSVSAFVRHRWTSSEKINCVQVNGSILIIFVLGFFIYM